MRTEAAAPCEREAASRAGRRNRAHPAATLHRSRACRAPSAPKPSEAPHFRDIGWRMISPLGLLSRRARAAALAALALGACQANKAPEAAAPATPDEATPASAESSPAAEVAPASAEPAAASIHTFTLNNLDGQATPLGSFEGKVLLVVNTASKCGYTPQYQGLQQLHAKYAERGFAVLGFPSNDFGGQEPGTAEEIRSFCVTMYDVNFPMFEKIAVVGEERSPLYALLSDAQGAPKWNFHKYLVDKHGRPVQAWPSATDPAAPEIASAIEAQLAAQ